VKLNAVLQIHSLVYSLCLLDEKNGEGYLRVQWSIRRFLKAQPNLIRRAIGIARPLAELGSNTVVGALQDLAGLVPVAFAVPAVLPTGAVCLDAADYTIHARYGDVEVVVASASGAAAFPSGNVPRPVGGETHLAGLETGSCQGAGREGEEGCEGYHDDRIGCVGRESGCGCMRW
jgi:hypothetical protein